MNYTYRKAAEAERGKYLDFANMVFSCAHVPHDFQALIPKVYGADKKTAHMHNIALDEQENIRGLVAVMPGELSVMGDILKTGFVGTVSTHPYGRGEGHMKVLMNMAIDSMRDEGVDLAMLGGQRQRYEYFGFTQGGISCEHKITRANVRHALKNVDPSGVEIIDVAAGDGEALKAINALYIQKPLYAPRGEDRFFEITRTWYSKLCMIKIDGAFAGYFISNSGAQLKRISEFMLNDYSHTAKIIKKLFEQYAPGELEVNSADFETELNRELAMFEEDQTTGHTVNMRVFNFVKVVGAFMKLKAAYAPLADGEAGFIIDGQQLTIRVHNGIVDVSDAPFADSIPLTQMQAQHLFFNRNGWLIAGRLPLGWAPLPAYINKVDEF